MNAGDPSDPLSALFGGSIAAASAPGAPAAARVTFPTSLGAELGADTGPVAMKLSTTAVDPFQTPQQRNATGTPPHRHMPVRC